jgi:hypothetical protein
LHPVGQRIDLTEHASTVFEQLLAGGGELGLARTAVEQQHIERVFELAHAVGQRGRHLAQFARRRGKAAAARDGIDHPQRFGCQRVAATIAHARSGESPRTLHSSRGPIKWGSRIRGFIIFECRLRTAFASPPVTHFYSCNIQLGGPE